MQSEKNASCLSISINHPSSCSICSSPNSQMEAHHPLTRVETDRANCCNAFQEAFPLGLWIYWYLNFLALPLLQIGQAKSVCYLNTDINGGSKHLTLRAEVRGNTKQQSLTARRLSSRCWDSAESISSSPSIKTAFSRAQRRAEGESILPPPAALKFAQAIPAVTPDIEHVGSKFASCPRTVAHK